MMQVVATAGHVDHGKSTLVRALTGMEPDRWAEERRRGMTIDLGFAWTQLPDGTDLAFVDVPGHERFVPNMLAGVGPVPAVVFAVAADDGWRPQSAEHLAAVDALGVRHGLLVVTRSDLADPGPVARQAGEQLAASSLAGAETVAVSATTGAGLDALRDALVRLVARLPVPDPADRLRLWVDRVFTVTGAGTVVTGTLGSGTLRVGDEVAVAATGRRVRVRALQSRGRPVPETGGVARVAVNLRGADVPDLGRGDALVRPGEWVMTTEADVRLAAARDLSSAAQLALHIGSAAVPTRLRTLPGRAVDGRSLGRIRLSRPLPLRIGDRGLLRDPSRHDLVIGVEILDPLPPALRRRGAAAARGRQLASVDLPSGQDEVARRRIVSRTVLRRLGVDDAGLRPLAGEWFVDPDEQVRLRAALQAYVERRGAEDPLSGGVPVGEVRAALDLPDAALIPALVSAPLAIAAGRVVRPATGAGLPGATADAVEQVRRDLLADPFGAPEADRLRELALGPRELAAAERLGLLLRVTEGIVLLPDAPAGAIERLGALPQPFTVSEARAALGTTRRVAVPLLEMLDRDGRTRRLADGTRTVTDRDRSS